MIKLDDSLSKSDNSLDTIFNVYYPEPITIKDLAVIVRAAIRFETGNRVNLSIEIVDSQQPMLFTEEDKTEIMVDTSKALKFLNLKNFKSPKQSIENIVRTRLQL